MNKFFLCVLVFALISCSKNEEENINWTITDCADYKSVEDTFLRKPELKKVRSSLAYYLFVKGKCELSKSLFIDAETSLTTSALLGEDSAAFELARYKLLAESDLSYLPIMQKLTQSNESNVSKNASMFVGLFLLVDIRAKGVVHVSDDILQSIGLELIEKHKGSLSGFYSYYFQAIYKGSDLTHLQRLSLIQEGDKLQEKSLGSIQVGCSDIYRQFAYFDIDKSKLLKKCPV